MTEGSYDLSLTRRGYVRLSVELRERYLTPEVDGGECIVQACGETVAIWLFSDRDSIRVDLPLDGFAVGRPYRQSVYKWGVNVARYDRDVGLDADETVEARVSTIEYAGGIPDDI